MLNLIRYTVAFVALLLAAYILIYMRPDSNLAIEGLVDFNSNQTGVPSGKHFLYSLPNGLWVFSMTLLANRVYVNLGKIKLGLSLIPVVYALLLEGIQALNFTDGTFSIGDVMYSIAGFALANLLLLIILKRDQEPIKFNFNMMLFIGGFAGLILFNNV